MEKKVSIVMATYNPNERYFIEQLKSIEDQTYRNIELLIYDDCSSIEKFKVIQNLTAEILKSTPYQIYRNKINMGSNKTFEELTRIADGEYIAFSDQDDQFDNEKIQVLVDLIEEENSVLAYSDSRVIDEESNVISNSFKEFSKRLIHVYGENIGPSFVRRNSVTGCTMIIRNDVAKKALPFPVYNIYVHDHWLTLIAASMGKISYSQRPLISYRIHGNNQIGSSLLIGIDDKESYIKNKLKVEEKKYFYLIENNHLFNNEVLEEAKAYLRDMESRINFFKRTNLFNLIKLIKNRRIDFQLFIYEILIATSPKFLQRMLIKIYKGG